MLAPFQLLYWRVAGPQGEGAKLLIEHEGKFLLIREAVGQTHWTLPGGRSKAGETPEETARRKAKEEAGVKLESLAPLGSYFHTRQHKNDVIAAFHGKVQSYDLHPDSNLIAEAGWFTLEEIRNLTKSESVDDVLELYTKTK